MSTSQSTGKGNEKAKPSVPNTSQENPGQKGADKKGPAPSGSGSILQDGDHARVPVPARSTSATTRSQAQRTHAPGANTSTSTAANPNQSTSENSTTSLEAITPGTKIAIASQAKGREGSLETNHKAIVRGPASSTTSAPKQKRIVFAEKILAKAEESLDDARVARLAADENSRKLCDAKIDLCEAECQTAIESLRLLEIGATDQERDRALEVFKAREAFYAAKVVTAEKLKQLLKDETSDNEISVTNDLYKAKEAVWEAKVNTAEESLRLLKLGASHEERDRTLEVFKAREAYCAAKVNTAEESLRLFEIGATKQVTTKALEPFKVWEAVCEARVSLCAANRAFFKRTRDSNIDELENSIAMSEALVSLRLAELDLMSPEVKNAPHLELEYFRAKVEYHRKEYEYLKGISLLFESGKKKSEIVTVSSVVDAREEKEKARENFRSAKSLFEAPALLAFGEILTEDIDYETIEWNDLMKSDKCGVILPLVGLHEFKVKAFIDAGFTVDTRRWSTATVDLMKICEVRTLTSGQGENELYDFMSPFRGVLESLSMGLHFGFNVGEKSTIRFENSICRTDFSVGLNSWTLMRFEYKDSPLSIDVASQELSTKCAMWSVETHGPVKHQLGVAIARRTLNVVTLNCSSRSQSVIKVSEVLSNLNLDDPSLKPRLIFLRILLNVAMYYKTTRWQAMRNEMPTIPSTRPAHIPRNENSVWYQTIRGEAVVHKALYRPGSEARIVRMKKFYEKCKGITGLERCLGWERNEQISHLQPLCADRPPHNTVEARAAIIGVVKTLIEIHKKGWIHGDVRWPNIRPHPYPTMTWYLIDCEFVIPSRAERVLSNATEIYEKGLIQFSNDDQIKDLLTAKGSLLDKTLDDQLQTGKIDLTLLDMFMVGKLTEHFNIPVDSEIGKLGKVLMDRDLEKRHEAFEKISQMIP